MSAKRQVVSSLVDVASSAELLGGLIIADDRAKPVSSNVAYTRTSATNVVAAAAYAKHIFVKRMDVKTPLKDIDRISTPPFSSSVNQSEAVRQLIRTSKSCLPGILMLCDEPNSEDLRSATWVPAVSYTHLTLPTKA